MLDLYTIPATAASPTSGAADERPQPSTRITESVETVDAHCAGILTDSIAV
jgi:hypothetical protein